MNIIIEGKQAAIAQDSQFELVFENSLFTDADAYSLNIKFPLAGCPENVKIFGFLNRIDIKLKKVHLNCEIVNGANILKGVIAITDLTDSDVTGQFLLGRSASNYDPKWDQTYINELHLGAPGDDLASPQDLTTANLALTPWKALTQFNYYALPWFNSNTTNTNVINDMRHFRKITNDDYFDAELNNRDSWSLTENPGGSWSPGFDDSLETGIVNNWKWTEATYPILSWMPNLLWLTKRLCNALDYSFDFSVWENDPGLKHVIVCNALPPSWGITDFARALPHWTVDEYFEKLELFLGFRVSIDHRARKISMTTIADELMRTDAAGNSVMKTEVLETVVDEFEAALSDDQQDSKYIGARNIIYASCDHQLWKFYACDWFVKNFEPRQEFSTPNQIHNAMKSAALTPPPSAPTNAAISKKLLHSANPAASFLIRCFRQTETPGSGYKYYYTAQVLNIAGSYLRNPDQDAEDDKVEFVPCRIDQINNYTDWCIFLPVGSFDEKDPDVQNQKKNDGTTIEQPAPVKALEAGEKSQFPEYFNRIYVAFWDGTQSAWQSSIDNSPYPPIGPVEIIPTWSDTESDTMTGWAVRQYSHFDFSLSARYDSEKSKLLRIEPTQCYKIKFMSRTVPDPKSVFLIKGRKFICSRLTTTASEKGISPLITGEFYPII